MKVNLNMRGIFSSQIEVSAKTQTVSNNELVIKEFKDTYAVVDPINVSGIDFNNSISLNCKPLEIVWPMIGCDAKHTCRSIFDTSGVKGNINWSLLVGGTLGDIIVVDAAGRVILVSGNTVYCVDLDGSIVWKYTLPDKGGIGATIGVGGVVYVPCEDGYMYALNSDGTLKWSSNIGEALTQPPVIYVDKNTKEEYIVFTDTVGKLYCLDSNGTLLWSKSSTQTRYLGFPAIDDNGNIYIYSGILNAPYVVAMDISGNELWSFDISTVITDLIHGQTAFPVIGSDGIYVMVSHGLTTGISATIIKLGFDGSLIWTKTLGRGGALNMAIDDNENVYAMVSSPVFIPSGSTSKLYKLTKDGDILWGYTTAISYAPNIAIGRNGTVYTGNDAGILLAISPDGNLIWKITFDAYLRGLAIAPNQKIYVTTTTSKLYCIG